MRAKLMLPPPRPLNSHEFNRGALLNVCKRAQPETPCVLTRGQVGLMAALHEGGGCTLPSVASSRVLRVTLAFAAYVCLHDVDFLPRAETVRALYVGDKDSAIAHALGRVDSLGGCCCCCCCCHYRHSIVAAAAFVVIAAIIIMLIVAPSIAALHLPGVVCGGSVTLSSAGGYPNGLTRTPPPPFDPCVDMLAPGRVFRLGV
jgi:hypothetical protein